MLVWIFLAILPVLQIFKDSKNSSKLREVSTHAGKFYWIKEWQPFHNFKEYMSKTTGKDKLFTELPTNLEIDILG